MLVLANIMQSETEQFLKGAAPDLFARARYAAQAPMHGDRKRKHECTEGERHLEDVKRNGLNLRDVPARYRADREIVLAAVQQNGQALKYAAEECKADREIVLAAVQQI
eukprot:4047363-Amphidinium_carterae.1